MEGVETGKFFKGLKFIIEVKSWVITIQGAKENYYGQVKKGTEEPFGFGIQSSK